MNKFNPTPFPELNEVLHDLVHSIQAILKDTFIGFYLQGSLATGGFDEHSDVDFLVVIDKEISSDQLEKLQAMHERIFSLKSYWAQHLEGSYFPKDILKSIKRCGEKLWYLDNGSRQLTQSDHCNTVVVRWLVREKGVVVIGPLPKTLIEEIDANTLRKDICNTMHTWGKKILGDPQRYNNHFYQTFIVLSYCRMLHDLIHGTNNSKQVCAEWAKKNLDPYWKGLIDRTWAGRPVPEQSIKRPADPKDFADTLKFVEYTLKASIKHKPADKTSDLPK
jgi:predicted nucleotidyltransferase